MPGIWKKTMVYLGLADDEEYADYGEYDDPDGYSRQGVPTSPASSYNAPPHPSYGSELPTGPSTVRMLPREEQGLAGVPSEPPARTSSAVRTIPAPAQKVHVVKPIDFADGAREIGDRFKASAPVIMNLATADLHVAKRVLDFASGLTYGLGGSMQKVGDSVFLLTPEGVDVTAEERRRLRENGLFDGLED